jgi:hypothetical protein
MMIGGGGGGVLWIEHDAYPSIDFTGTFTGTCLSRRTILLKYSKIKLVPVAGLEPARLFKVPGF